MKSFNKLLGATMALTLSVSSVDASPISIGGVVWDPMSTTPLTDFFANSNFDQWIQSSNATGINDADRMTVLFNNPAALVGGYLYGSGITTAINGTDDIPGGSGLIKDFCPDCELTFSFGNIKITGYEIVTVFGNNYLNLSFDFSQGFANIYVDDLVDGDGTNTFPSGTRPDAESANDGALWLSLSFDAFNFTPAANVVGGNVSAQLHVTGGMAQGHFDTNPSMIDATPVMPGVDWLFTSSAIFNSGTNLARGSADHSADSIPEPASLALLSIGLFGIYGSRNRQQKKNS